MVITGKPVYFFTERSIAQWFKRNHLKAEDLWIGFTKPKAKKQALGYKRVLDEALCHGWIDGIRKSIDDELWMIRFTPRRKNSIWSQVNLKRMNELIAEGKVTAQGMKVFRERDPKRTNQYSSENRHIKLSAEYVTIFRKNKKAWKWFSEAATSYRKTASFLVMSAKNEETRLRRLKRLIEDSEAGRKLRELTYVKK